METQLICQNCGYALKPNWSICPKCKTQVGSLKCTKCGEELEADWDICPNCQQPQMIANSGQPLVSSVPIDTPTRECFDCGEKLEPWREQCPKCGKPVHSVANAQEPDEQVKFKEKCCLNCGLRKSLSPVKCRSKNNKDKEDDVFFSCGEWIEISCSQNNCMACTYNKGKNCELGDWQDYCRRYLTKPPVCSLCPYWDKSEERCNRGGQQFIPNSCPSRSDNLLCKDCIFFMGDNRTCLQNRQPSSNKRSKGCGLRSIGQKQQ